MKNLSEPSATGNGTPLSNHGTFVLAFVFVEGVIQNLILNNAVTSEIKVL